MKCAIAGLDPAAYRPHRLHDPERRWPQTNCYVDLLIEGLHATGHDPVAARGFTVAQDFEGDQFTFFKVPLEDLEALYGVRATELAIFDSVEGHIAEQIGRGRLCMVEMDSYFMPDTQGVSYRTEHGKTTIAINRMDVANRSLDYFHNGGFFDHDGWILKNAHRLHGIPGWIAQGRFDVVTPLEGAWKLKKAWPQARLDIVWDAGHASTEPGIIDALVRGTDAAAAL